MRGKSNLPQKIDKRAWIFWGINNIRKEVLCILYFVLLFRYIEKLILEHNYKRQSMLACKRIWVVTTRTKKTTFETGASSILVNVECGF